MPFGNWYPTFTPPFVDIVVYVVGFMGALALSYAVLLEAEKRQDAVFVVASASLFVYALIKSDYIFMLAMALMFIISLRELIQILRGKHLHSTEMIKEYEKE